MEEEIKVSELPEASQLNDSDLVMIVQGQANKKIAAQTFNSNLVSRVSTNENDIDTLESRVGVLEDKNVMTITKTQDQTVSANASPVIITMDSSNSVGTKLTYTNNSIKIGQGISKVLVSGMAWVSATNGYKWLTARRKRGSNYYNFSQAITPLNTSELWDSISLIPVLLDVQENDELSLWVAITGSASGKVEGGTYTNSCFLTVEVIS